MCVYNNLLNSNAFLDYPHLCKDVFKAMKDPRFKIILQKNYNKNPDNLIHRIIYCFRVIIHRLYIKFSSSYRTHFSGVKNHILKIKEEEIKFISSLKTRLEKVNLKSKTLHQAEDLKKNLEVYLNVKNEKIASLKSELASHAENLREIDSDISTLSLNIFEAKKDKEQINNQPFMSLINFFRPQETADTLSNSEKKLVDLESILEIKVAMQEGILGVIEELDRAQIKNEQRKFKTEKLIEEQKIEIKNLETLFKHSKQKVKNLISSNMNVFSLITEEPSSFEPPMKEFLREILISSDAEIADDELSSKQIPLDIPKQDRLHVPKTPKTITIETLERFNPDLAKILTSFLSRFEGMEITSFTEQDGIFDIMLPKPLKLWIPKIKETDPIGGSILLFGMETLVSGKLTNTSIEFTSGFEVYCKQPWYGFLTASISAITKKANNVFELTAGKYGINQSETCLIDETVHTWSSPEISEVVKGNHEAFLKTKL